jgi:hypothetical protein
LFGCIKDPIWKYLAQQTVIVAVNHAVNTSRNSQTLNIGPEAGCKILTESSLLRLIEQISVFEIFQGIIRDPTSFIVYRWFL